MAELRRAVVTIEWVGPDKPIRELIEEAMDRLFEESLAMHPKVGYATSAISYTPRVRVPDA